MAKLPVQQNLFSGSIESNLVSMEDYLESVKPKRKREESKFMDSIITAAHSLSLPCIHIEYFCGNKFWATCESCTRLNQRRYPYAPRVQAICPQCHKPVLVTCVNRINKGLTGHWDILGIDWAIETKHRTHKMKVAPAKLSDRQKIKGNIYNSFSVPHIAVHELDQDSLWGFLRDQHTRKFGKPF